MKRFFAVFSGLKTRYFWSAGI